MLNQIADEIKEWAESKGWDSKVGVNGAKFGEQMALMTSELSEALEEYRNGHVIDEIYYNGNRATTGSVVVSKPEGIPIELADCIIRILHFCADNDINIDKALELKMKYNKTRPFRHGGKLA